MLELSLRQVLSAVKAERWVIGRQVESGQS